MTGLAFPFGVSASGRTATVTGDEELATMVLQVLRTALGTRVNRSDFGSRVDQMVFAAASAEFAGAVEVMVRSALSQWLMDVIEVQSVVVTSDDSQLWVQITYAALPSRKTVTQTLSQPIGFG